MKTTASLLSALLSLSLATAPGGRAADAPSAGTPVAATAPVSTPGTTVLAPTRAADGPRTDPTEIAADALVVRPVGIAATAVGAAIFVVALPFAALARDVKGTAEALVGAPARFTFQRRLGDFEGQH